MTQLKVDKIIRFTKTQPLVFAAILITLLAFIPRFYNLNHLGFYGDEEITATASKYISLEGHPEQESGLPYYRAITHSIINSFFASMLSTEKESSYRFFSAIVGSIFIGLLIIFIKPFLGTWPAIICGLLLAFSEWHITLSREARMYGLLVVFYTLSSLFSWRWVLEGGKKYLITSLIFSILAVNMHVVSILLALNIMIPFILNMAHRTHILKALSFSLFLILFTYVHEKIINIPFIIWTTLNDYSSANVINDKNSLFTIPIIFKSFSNAVFIITVIVVLMGLRLAFITTPRNKNFIHTISCFALITASTLMCGLGQIYGATIFLLSFFIVADNAKKLIREHFISFSLIAVSLVISSLILYFQLGAPKAFALPFPYLIYIAKQYPTLIVFFLVAVLFLAFAKHSNDNNKILTLAALIPIIFVGFVVESRHDIRYVAISYPFILAIVSKGIYDISQLICAHFQVPRSTQLLILLALTSTVLIKGHNVFSAYYSATLEYGDLIPGKKWPYPDHKTTGEFVKKHLRHGDIVIAEDVLEQGWYVKQVDYWLRSQKSTKGSFYRGKDGRIRNIYTNALGLTHQELTYIKSLKDRRIWIITSAETSSYWNYNLSMEQLKWIKDIRSSRTPIYKGLDGITEVYLLNP